MNDTLYKDGDFKIAPWKGLGWQSWIWHRCGKVPMWRSSTLLNTGRSRCGWCRTEVPQNLEGLWRLHNFESIQTIKIG